MLRSQAALVLLCGGAVAQTNPEFTFHFSGPCGQTIEGAPGSLYDDGTGGRESFANGRSGHSWDVILTTVENPGGVGVQAWSWCAGASGALALVDVTTNGTRGCPRGQEPPCLAAFSFTRLTGLPYGEGPQTVENHGAVGAVVLGLGKVVTLPPTGNEVIAKVRVFAEFPEAAGETASGRVFFAPRATDRGPAEIALSWRGEAVTPDKGDPPLLPEDCEVSFEAVPPGGTFIRCDANEDGKLDLGDAIWILNQLFRGGPTTRCPPAADCDADGARRITDAIFAIRYQLAAGPPPPPPFPGCGPAPGVTVDNCPVESPSCR